MESAMILTSTDSQRTIRSLSVGKLSGIETPLEGHELTAITRGFFVLIKNVGTLRALAFIHYGGLYWATVRLAAPSSGSLNPIQPATQSLRPLFGGYSTFRRNTAMIDLSNSANYAVNPSLSPLYSIFLHRQAAIFAKFQGFEGGAI